MKKITLELEDVVFEKVKKQFEELGVDFKTGLVYLIEEFCKSVSAYAEAGFFFCFFIRQKQRQVPRDCGRRRIQG